MSVFPIIHGVYFRLLISIMEKRKKLVRESKRLRYVFGESKVAEGKALMIGIHQISMVVPI